MYHSLCYCSLRLWRAPLSTLFPYTTLFRSVGETFFNANWNIAFLDKDPEVIEKLQETGRYKVKVHKTDDVVENIDRKSTRLNSSHVAISYAVFCLKKNKRNMEDSNMTYTQG